MNSFIVEGNYRDMKKSLRWLRKVEQNFYDHLFGAIVIEHVRNEIYLENIYKYIFYKLLINELKIRMHVLTTTIMKEPQTKKSFYVLNFRSAKMTTKSTDKIKLPPFYKR